MNILIGKTKSGKSCLFNFLTNKNLNFTPNRGYKGRIEFEINSDEQGAIIGNGVESETSKPKVFELLCDFPGLQDNRDDEFVADSVFHCYNQLIKYEYVRLIVVISSELIQNGSELLDICDRIVSLYCITEDHLKGIHVILSKCENGDGKEMKEFIKIKFTKRSNPIIEGIKTGDIKISEFLQPQKDNDGNYSFSDENRNEIISNAMSTQFLRRSILPLDKWENNLYKKAKKYNENSIRINEERKPNQRKEYIFSRDITSNKVEAEKIIFIDDDIEIQTDNLTFCAPLMIVRKKQSDGICKLTVVGNSHPSVTFKNEIDDIVHSEDFHIIFQQNYIDERVCFPDACDKKFGQGDKWYHIRIESVLMNGFLTEYCSFNNKHLDLIAYCNMDFGRIIYETERRIAR